MCLPGGGGRAVGFACGRLLLRARLGWLAGLGLLVVLCLDLVLVFVLVLILLLVFLFLFLLLLLLLVLLFFLLLWFAHRTLGQSSQLFMDCFELRRKAGGGGVRTGQDL